jgi:hypothetical protein
MDAAPFYAPTYFPASYFYSAVATAPSSTTTGLLPYNAPTYFPPAYFYGASSLPSTGLLPYNAPTYFPPAYFYGASSPAIVPVSPSPDGFDPDSYEALIRLLKATGVFIDVIFGAATRRSQAGADTYPLAILTPKGWEESDDVDPESIVRRTTFTITVVVKSEDDEPEFDQLDRLSCAIKKVVDRSSLDGTCVPALTRIRSGHFVYSTHYPEQCIDLEGEFSSIIDPSSNGPATT